MGLGRAAKILGGISLKKFCFNAGCDRAKMGRKGCAKIKDPAGLGGPEWGRNNCCRGKNIKRSCQDFEPPCRCKNPGKCRQGDKKGGGKKGGGKKPGKCRQGG